MFGQRSREILEMVDRGEVAGVISSLVQLEICWYLESRGRVDDMSTVIHVLQESRLEYVDVIGGDVSEAVELKQARRDIDLNDLVNYCVMRRLGVSDIFTNDKHFTQLVDINPLF
jgi:predicted nucleic acid-binding protein